MTEPYVSNITRNITIANSTPSATATGPSSHENIESELVVIFFMLSVLALCIVLINCLVVFLVWKKETLRTQANVYLASLACSDLLTGSLAIPLVMGCSMSSPPDKGHVCLAMDLINRFLSISAILHLLVIAVERYVVIVRYLRSADVINWKRTAVVLVIVWVVPLVTSFIQLSWYHYSLTEERQSHLARIEVTYDLVCVFGIALLLLLIIIMAFTRIFCVLRRHSQDIAKQTAHLRPNSKTPRQTKMKERRATVIYASMILVYIIGWFSYFLLTLLHDLAPEDSLSIPAWADTILMFCRFATSLVNPVLYTFFKQDFKQAISSLRRELETEADMSASSTLLSSRQGRTSRKCTTPITTRV